MNAAWVLFLLISLSALPVLLAYLWLRLGRFPLSFPWFCIALLTGAAGLMLAALMQLFIPEPAKTSLWTLLYTVFIRVALPEEAGRLAALLLLFGTGSRLGKKNLGPAQGAATGLVAGLGFAVIENAFYGAADMRIALLRAFTAAPLHGACGSRAGLASVKFGSSFFQGSAWFLSAVIIHGAYNLLLVSPGAPRLLPIIIAFAMLITPIRIIRSGWPDTLPNP